MPDTDDVAGRLIWFFAGALLGAGVALLYAPASGRATRRLIRRKAEKSGQALAETGRDWMEKGRELYEKGRQMADEAAEMFDRGKKLVEP